MPALLTIDTLTALLTRHILHPFPFLLISLSLLALGYPAATFTPYTLHISLPSVVPLCTLIFITLWTLRFLGRIDTSFATRGCTRKLVWDEEVVLITGGLGGLGKLLAEVYAMRGVSVAVVDVLEIGAEKERELREKGIGYWRCDVGDRDAVVKMAEGVKKEFGPPTILINNAATITPGPFLSLSPTAISSLYRTNLLSHYHTTQAFLPAMLARPHGGTIVTISSVLGYLGCAGLAGYTSSKAALSSLHRSLTAELALLASSNDDLASFPASISTLLVTPGQLSTPLFRSVRPPSTFLGPTVEVQELAAAIVQRVDETRGGELSMPLYARWIAVLNLLPPGLAGVVRGLAGLDRAGWEAFVVGRERTEE